MTRPGRATVRATFSVAVRAVRRTRSRCRDLGTKIEPSPRRLARSAPPEGGLAIIPPSAGATSWPSWARAALPSTIVAVTARTTTMGIVRRRRNRTTVPRPRRKPPAAVTEGGWCVRRSTREAAVAVSDAAAAALGAGRSRSRERMSVRPSAVTATRRIVMLRLLEPGRRKPVGAVGLEFGLPAPVRRREGEGGVGDRRVGLERVEIEDEIVPLHGGDEFVALRLRLGSRCCRRDGQGRGLVSVGMGPHGTGPRRSGPPRRWRTLRHGAGQPEKTMDMMRETLAPLKQETAIHARPEGSRAGTPSLRQAKDLGGSDGESGAASVRAEAAPAGTGPVSPAEDATSPSVGARPRAQQGAPQPPAQQGPAQPR